MSASRHARARHRAGSRTRVRLAGGRTSARGRLALKVGMPVAAVGVTATAAFAWVPGAVDPDRVVATTVATGTVPDADLRYGRVSRDERTPLPDPSRPAASAAAAPAPVEPPPAPAPPAEPAPPPVPEVVGTKYATADLRIRTAPTTDAESVAVVQRGSELAVTGTVEGQWVQVVHDGAVAWVNGDYVADQPPAAEEPAAPAGLSGDPCPTGPSESGLAPDTVRVLRAVCAAFPSIDSYGGLRGGGGEHSVGRALDIMVSGSLGDEVAAYVRSNAGALGVSEVIWSQRIWTVERSADGWRWMEDRGSTTANHYDHVHVTVFGDSGG
jgi:hypothetical protein